MLGHCVAAAVLIPNLFSRESQPGRLLRPGATCGCTEARNVALKDGSVETKGGQGEVADGSGGIVAERDVSG